jgi:hypothetical protein
MLALLEEMYHELGLVEELDIHPSTLKRWKGDNVLQSDKDIILGFCSVFKKTIATTPSTTSVTASVCHK